MLSPVPDIGQVARQAPGQQENGVDADVVACPGVSRRQPLGGNRDPAQAVMVEGHGGAGLAGTGLDLDKGEGAAAAGDEVDLAAGHARPGGEDPPAMQPQPPGGEPLGAAAALLGQDAPVQRLSSRARA